MRGIDRTNNTPPSRRPARGPELPDYRAVMHVPSGTLVAETAGEFSQDMAFAIARSRNRTGAPGHVVIDGRGTVI